MMWKEDVFGMSWWEMPWCIGENISVVRYPCEATRGRHKQWGNFQNSFLSRDLWIFRWWGGVSRGLIIEMLLQGLELLGFS